MATLKIQSAEIEPFWATPEILFFWRMRFSNFFLNYMVWKYQNEIAPIFYYGISTKTTEKDIKISKLQPPDWKSPYWMSLYISTRHHLFYFFISEKDQQWLLLCWPWLLWWIWRLQLIFVWRFLSRLWQLWQWLGGGQASEKGN